MNSVKSKIVAVFKIFCIAYLVIFLPKIIFEKSHNLNVKDIKSKEFLTGFQNLLCNQEKYNFLKKFNFALISDSDDDLDKNVKTLTQNGFIIKKIFIPNSFNKFNENSLKDVNGIFVNLNYSGLRFDKSLTFLYKILNISGELNKRVVILDKPNPLGFLVEGPGKIPFKPGLTLGELAYYINKNILKKEVKLSVVPMVGWNRLLGSNTVDSGHYSTYSFLKILGNIQPIDVGPLTPYPYEVLLFSDNNSLTIWEVNYLKKFFTKYGFDCSNYSYLNKNNQRYFKGLRLEAKNGNSCQSFNLMVNLLRFLKNRKNLNLSYKESFDTIIGSNITREYLQGNIPFDNFKKKVEKDLTDFYTKSKDCFLYTPLPQVSKVQLFKC